MWTCIFEIKRTAMRMKQACENEIETVEQKMLLNKLSMSRKRSLETETEALCV